jgi:hypothetical protein
MTAIDELIERGALPVPVRVNLDVDPAEIHLRAPAEVHEWARYLRAHTARQIHVAGEGRSRTYTLIHILGVLVLVQAPGARR